MRLDDGDDPDRDDVMNLTPMVDVVFLLLVFFLAATTFANEEVELDLRLPEARTGEVRAPGQPMVVNLAADGRILVQGREVTLEALRQKLAAAQQRDPKQAVVVRGDREAQFGLGLQILDACRAARLTKVEFAALPAHQR